jgi:hypothetical protein
VEGPCVNGIEPSGSKKGRKLLDYLSDCWLLKKESAPWSYTRMRSIFYAVLHNDFLYELFLIT